MPRKTERESAQAQPAIPLEHVGRACRSLRNPFDKQEVKRGLLSLREVEERVHYLDFVLKKRNEAHVVKVFRVLPTVKDFSRRCARLLERKKIRPQHLNGRSPDEDDHRKIPIYYFHGYRKFAFFEDKKYIAHGANRSRSSSPLRQAKTEHSLLTPRGETGLQRAKTKLTKLRLDEVIGDTPTNKGVEVTPFLTTSDENDELGRTQDTERDRFRKDLESFLLQHNTPRRPRPVGFFKVTSPMNSGTPRGNTSLRFPTMERSFTEALMRFPRQNTSIHPSQ
eukprot:TRINITY_DN1814_c0_g2_i1.p1 TRINITY_DN1814_c0_g2~~TRINITY_DN1814_c0_g2_i1.p1  ORF type:complete len:280 (-),score=45.92 TRINITY_DN1814_c0_g2_i1:203-1042(-)